MKVFTGCVSLQPTGDMFTVCPAFAQQWPVQQPIRRVKKNGRKLRVWMTAVTLRHTLQVLTAQCGSRLKHAGEAHTYIHTDIHVQ